MLAKRDSKKEQQLIQNLIASDDALLNQHMLFTAEMDFKQKLIEARKINSLTQKDISMRSGLSQQAVSRLENGKGATLSTLIRYLHSIGYSLSIQKL